MMIEGSGSGAGSEAGSIPLTSGSGSGFRRPKRTRIRIKFQHSLSAVTLGIYLCVSEIQYQSLNIFRQPVRQWNQLYTLLAAKLRSRLPTASGACSYYFSTSSFDFKFTVWLNLYKLLLEIRVAIIRTSMRCDKGAPVSLKKIFRL
jgi:hypothetical protein